MSHRQATRTVRLVLSDGPEARIARMLGSFGRLKREHVLLDGERIHVISLRVRSATFSQHGILMISMPGWKKPKELFEPGAVREISFGRKHPGVRNPILDRQLLLKERTMIMKR